MVNLLYLLKTILSKDEALHSFASPEYQSVRAKLNQTASARRQMILCSFTPPHARPSSAVEERWATEIDWKHIAVEKRSGRTDPTKIEILTHAPIKKYISEHQKSKNRKINNSKTSVSYRHY